MNVPYGYGQWKERPGPELLVQIGKPYTAAVSAPLMCVIDTGACVTAIPERFVEQLLPLSYRPCKIAWGGGYESKQSLFTINLIVGSTAFMNVEVTTTKKDYGLIGRDLLNGYLLTCDGPNRLWSTAPRWA